MPNLEIHGSLTEQQKPFFSEEAKAFLVFLQTTFNPRRQELLEARKKRQANIDAGKFPTFLPETEQVRTTEWQVAPIPEDLQDRRAEITGPVERKMVINALNSGARVFMADLEDASSPTWGNMMDGQVNLYNANRRQIDFTDEKRGKSYKLNDEVATLKVRPRGWHLLEKNVTVDGQPMSASLFDFGLYFFHNAKYLLENGSGPYFYLPKLESHLEARLWNDVFEVAQEKLGIPNGSVKVTVLVETITAAFEMEEIIYELRDHMAGLNAGRWDYIFSAIKRFRNQMESPLPDRSQITMTVPFMKSYAQLLVKACHKHGAHAIGGMAAFIPSRKDEEINKKAFAKVKADKEREANDGYDGTWVAHPDLVKVAEDVFDRVLGDKPHQKDVKREDITWGADDLLNFNIEGGKITEDGLRLNANVSIRYIASWLSGVGAAAIFNLMEDAATAEISRSQIWQWIQKSATLESGQTITAKLVGKIYDEELEKIESEVGKNQHLTEAHQILKNITLTKEFPDFLTLEAYDKL